MPSAAHAAEQHRLQEEVARGSAKQQAIDEIAGARVRVQGNVDADVDGLRDLGDCSEACV